METLLIVYCTCGLEIPDGSFNLQNGCNEEGEDYYEGWAECECGKQYEWSEWGLCEGLPQAKEDLRDREGLASQKKSDRPS